MIYTYSIMQNSITGLHILLKKYLHLITNFYVYFQLFQHNYIKNYQFGVSISYGR